MSFWGWASAIAAGWLVASFVIAAGWWLISRKRGPRPVPGDSHLRIVEVDDVYDVERDGGL